MPTITITFTDSTDPNTLPQSYTLPPDVAEKLILVADKYGRDPMRQAMVLLAEGMGIWNPGTPAQIAKAKAADQPAPASDQTRGQGRNRAPAKDANGTPAPATIGSVPLTGTGLS